MGVGGQRHAPAALHPGKTRYPLYRRLGGRQGRSGRVRKISPPPGFDPRTFQPVMSGYTGWAIPANATMEYRIKIMHLNNRKPRQVWKTRVVGARVRRWPTIELEDHMRKLPTGGD